MTTGDYANKDGKEFRRSATIAIGFWGGEGAERGTIGSEENRSENFRVREEEGNSGTEMALCGAEEEKTWRSGSRESGHAGKAGGGS